MTSIEKQLLDKYSHLEKKVHEDTNNLFFKFPEGMKVVIDNTDHTPIKIAREIQPLKIVTKVKREAPTAEKLISTFKKSYYKAHPKKRVVMFFTYSNGDEKGNYKNISEAAKKLKMSNDQIGKALKNSTSVYSIDFDCMVKFRRE